jgi:maleamate amidohydrolase
MIKQNEADLAEFYRAYGYQTERIGFGKKAAIVVVDFQLGITHREGEISPYITDAVIETGKLLDAARKIRIPVIHVVTAFNPTLEDMPRWKLPHMQKWVYGDETIRVDERVWGQSDVLLYKKAPSAFHQTALVSTLIKLTVDTTIITGCVTSGCIRATIIDSFSYGFFTIVPRECVGDYHLVPHNQNLEDVSRRYADVMPVEEVLTELYQRNGG